MPSAVNASAPARQPYASLASATATLVTRMSARTRVIAMRRAIAAADSRCESPAVDTRAGYMSFGANALHVPAGWIGPLSTLHEPQPRPSGGPRYCWHDEHARDGFADGSTYASAVRAL